MVVDDEQAVADAGVTFPALPAGRLGTEELVEIALVDRAGASGPKLLPADSGFWAKTTFDRQHGAGWKFPIGVHHAPATNRSEPLAEVEAEHRQHAVVELAIGDLEDQTVAHFPSGRYSANSAWTVIAAPAHNLQRWTQLLALPGQTVRTARTVRRELLTIPAQLARSTRKTRLRMRARWPWAANFLVALAQLRALPPPA